MSRLRYFIRNVYRTEGLIKTLAIQYKNYYLSVLPNHPLKCIPNYPYNFVQRLSDRKASKCWNCGANQKLDTDLICNKCNVIQEPRVTNDYFKVFNVPEDYNINLGFLKTTYRKYQAILHPDKFSNKSEREKTISAEYSSLVNKAYATLQQPLNRAIHMLSLRGEKIEEDQNVSDTKFLMMIMELNEEVEEANSPDQLRQLNEKNKAILEELGKDVSQYFKEENVEKAKETVVKMKYYNSISLRINALMREKGIID